MINSFRKNILIATAMLVGIFVNAQDATATTATPVASTDNVFLYLLLAGCAILLVAILLLSNVWINLTKLVLDKRAGKIVSVLFLVFSCNFLFAQGTVAADTTFKLPLPLDVLVGILVFAVELITVIWILFAIRKLLNELAPAKETKPYTIHLPHIFDNINASVAVERESDILLDHDYDGIRELDNSLPPWWKYSFYISILWAFLYLGYYYFGEGLSSHEEYIAEVQQAKIEVDEYNKKNALNVDESNVQLADALGIADGMEIFKTNCTPCHGNVGEGNAVGPNLADDYWLHGGSISDIFKSIKYGWTAKGMKSWQADLSPVQIKNVASYIVSLRGTNPSNAKEPQGDLYIEKATAESDSITVAVADSTNK